MRRGLFRTLGRSGVAAALIGVAALVVMLFVQGYIGGGDSGALAAFVEDRGRDPVDMIVSRAGSRRAIVIGDIPGSGAPKELAQTILRELAGGRGVDALVVDVDSAHQPAFDRYTATRPEDASILTRAPGLLPAGEAGRQALELYRAVWAINEELGADRRMRILAVAPGAWPPPTALPPRAAAEAYAARGQAMADRVAEQMLERTSRARVVAVVDALHALRATAGELRVGGGGAIRADWFAAALSRRYPVDVFSVLPDAAMDMSGYPIVAQYAGTRLHERLRKAVPARAVGLPAAGAIAEPRDPVIVRTGPGISLTIVPTPHTLAELTDVYVFLP